MDPIQGISFYDSINRLAIGFLASLCFYSQLQSSIVWTEVLFVAIYMISCFIFGLFFSLIVDAIAEGKNHAIIKCIIYKNDLKRIRRLAKKIGVKLSSADKQSDIPSYWHIYYSVQKNNLLGNVPALETISAFLLNLCCLSFIYLVGSLVAIAITRNCCQLIWIPILAMFLMISCTISRYYIETKIYRVVLSAAKYLEKSH